MADLHPAGAGTLENARQWRYAGPAREGENDALQGALAFASSQGWSVEIRDGEFDEIPEAEVLSGNLPTELNIIVEKPSGTAAYFLHPRNAIAHLDDAEIETTSAVFILAEFTAFRAGGRRIEPWNGDPIPAPEAKSALPNDVVSDIRRGLVRDLSGGRLPTDLFRWLPSAPMDEGSFSSAWMQAATDRLMLALGTEVEASTDGHRIVLGGMRKRSFRATAPTEVTSAQFEALRQTVEWLLIPARDAEARHQMLVRRLETLVLDDHDAEWWPSVAPHLREALAGARTEYRMFITSKSADLLKTMADVRKAVAEDVDRIVGRTNRLSQAFIGGLGVLVAGLGVRIAGLASTSGSSLPALVFCGAVLFVTWCGLRMNEAVGSRSLRADVRHLRRWHSRLHQSLSRSEYRSLAISPVLEAVRLYNQTRRETRKAFRVAALIFVVLVIAPMMMGTLR